MKGVLHKLGCAPVNVDAEDHRIPCLPATDDNARVFIELENGERVVPLIGSKFYREMVSRHSNLKFAATYRFCDWLSNRIYRRFKTTGKRTVFIRISRRTKQGETPRYLEDAHVSCAAESAAKRQLQHWGIDRQICALTGDYLAVCILDGLHDEKRNAVIAMFRCAVDIERLNRIIEE